MIVELPNKEEIEFPDDTPSHVVNRVIGKNYPGMSPVADNAWKLDQQMQAAQQEGQQVGGIRGTINSFATGEALSAIPETVAPVVQAVKSVVPASFSEAGQMIAGVPDALRPTAENTPLIVPLMPEQEARRKEEMGAQPGFVEQTLVNSAIGQGVIGAMNLANRVLPESMRDPLILQPGPGETQPGLLSKMGSLALDVPVMALGGLAAKTSGAVAQAIAPWVAPEIPKLASKLVSGDISYEDAAKELATVMFSGLATGGAGALAKPLGAVPKAAAEVGAMTESGALAQGKAAPTPQEVAEAALMVGALHMANAVGSRMPRPAVPVSPSDVRPGAVTPEMAAELQRQSIAAVQPGAPALPPPASPVTRGVGMVITEQGLKPVVKESLPTQEILPTLPQEALAQARTVVAPPGATNAPPAPVAAAEQGLKQELPLAGVPVPSGGPTVPPSDVPPGPNQPTSLPGERVPTSSQDRIAPAQNLSPGTNIFPETKGPQRIRYENEPVRMWRDLYTKRGVKPPSKAMGTWEDVGGREGLKVKVSPFGTDAETMGKEGMEMGVFNHEPTPKEVYDKLKESLIPVKGDKRLAQEEAEYAERNSEKEPVGAPMAGELEDGTLVDWHGEIFRVAGRSTQEVESAFGEPAQETVVHLEDGTSEAVSGYERFTNADKIVRPSDPDYKEMQARYREQLKREGATFDPADFEDEAAPKGQLDIEGGVSPELVKPITPGVQGDIEAEPMNRKPIKDIPGQVVMPEGQEPGVGPKRTQAEELAALADSESAQELHGGLGFVGGRRQVIRPDEVPDAVKHPNPEVERRLQASRGMKEPSSLGKFKTRIGDAWRRATRVYEHIPNTPEFATYRERLRIFHAIPEYAQDKVHRAIATIMDPLGPSKASPQGSQQKILFERYLIQQNKMESLERGEPLRHGETAEEASAYADQLQDVVDKTPAVQEALKRRAAIVDELKGEIDEYGLLPEGADREAYWHQQVLSKAQEQRAAKGGTTPRPKKRGFQKARSTEDLTGEEYDYNTDYIEAETSWMTDARIEIEKAKWLKELGETPTQSENLVAWQPKPGNMFYPATTITEKAAEALRAGELEKLSPDDLKTVLALGGRNKEYMLPKEVADQLDTMLKPAPDSGSIPGEFMKMWKQAVLFMPQRVGQYMLRNATGDIDPVIGGGLPALTRIPKATTELWRYYKGNLSMTPEMDAAIKHDVMNSGLTAANVPDLKDLAIFRRFYRSGGVKGVMRLPEKYFSTVKKYNEFRESVLRYSAFLYARDALSKETMKHFGASRSADIKAIMRDMGVDAAAARYARDLLGDYGSMTVTGTKINENLVPFYRWMEVNAKRYPRMAINAVEWGGRKGNNPVSKAAFSAIAVGALATPYAAMHAWNRLMHPEEEKDLDQYTRENPHIIYGRNTDGSVSCLKGAGALGDVLEWFGVNDLATLLPQLENGQVTIGDVAKIMAKAPLNKAYQGLRPDLKAAFEVAGGVSFFPDVTQPRKVSREDAILSAIPLREEVQAIKGAVLKEGDRARPHYLQRYLTGIVDAKQAALGSTYDLMDKYLASKGKDQPDFGGKSNPHFVNMRKAAANNDRKAFDEALAAYKKDGKKAENFNSSFRNVNPVARLSKDDQKDFRENFLTQPDRDNLAKAEKYASEIQARMREWSGFSANFSSRRGRSSNR